MRWLNDPMDSPYTLGRRRASAGLALVALFAVACHSGQGPDRSAEQGTNRGAERGSERSGPTCDAKGIEQLDATVTTWCAVDRRWLPFEAPQVPWSVERPTPPSLESTVQLRLAASGVLLGELEREVQIADMSEELPEGPWNLVIEADTPRAHVATLLRAMVDTQRLKGELVLTTRDMAGLPKPADPAVLAALDQKLGSVPPDQWTRTWAEEMRERMPKCPEFVSMMQAMATLRPESYCPYLAKTFGRSYVDCGCPELAELETMLYALVVGTAQPERLAVVLPVTLEPTAQSRPGETWAEIVAGLDAAALEGLWVAER